MTTVQVFRLDGHIEYVAQYSLSPEQAVVAAARQAVGDHNTWDYPTPEQAGVRPSTIRPDVRILFAETGDVFFGFPGQPK